MDKIIIKLNSNDYFLNGDIVGKTNEVIKDNTKYVLKLINDNGLTAHRDILKNLESSKYKKLVIPKYIDHGTMEERKWVLLEYLTGSDYNSKWNEHLPEISGGRAIGLDTVNVFLDLVGDLTSIDVSGYVNNPIEKVLPDKIFAQYKQSTGTLLGKNWITQSQANQGEDLINRFAESLQAEFQISNGDFQFRNFIDLSDGKVGVIDWEGCRLSNFELEHMIAYQWILMWNNPMWQKKLIQEATKRLVLDKGRFQCVLLFDALNQAADWSNDSNIGRIQADYFINSLNQDYIDFLFDN